MLYWCIIIIIIIEIYFSCPSSLNLVFSLRQIWKHKTKPKLIFFNFHAAAETWSLPIDESFHIIEPNYLITKKFIVRFLLIGNEFSIKCVECCLESVFFFFWIVAKYNYKYEIPNDTRELGLWISYLTISDFSFCILTAGILLNKIPRGLWFKKPVMSLHVSNNRKSVRISSSCACSFSLNITLLSSIL